MDELKGVCLALAQEALKPTNLFDPYNPLISANLERMLAILDWINVSSTVAEYTFFPIRSLLQQNKLGERQIELIFRVISRLCRTAWNNKSFELERSQQLTSVVSFLLSPEPPTKQETGIEPSDAFLSKPAGYRAAGFDCFDAIFTAATSAGFAAQLGQSPAIADIIALLLNGIQYDSDSLDAQLSSIRALQLVLTQLVVNRDHRALVLPRVVSKLTKFINVANKRHYAAKVAALNCLKCCIVGCLGGKEDDDEVFGSQVITKEWLEQTKTNLKHTFTTIQKLQASLLELGSSRPELVVAVLNFAESIFTECKNVLSEPCRELVLDIIILTKSQNLSVDASKRAQKFLDDMNVDSTSSDAIEAGFMGQLEKIPSIMQSPNVSKSTLALQSLQTIVSMVGSNENCLAVIDAIEASLTLSFANRSGVVPKAPSVVKAIDNYDGTTAGYINLSSLGLKLEMSDAVQQGLVKVLAEAGTISGENLTKILIGRLQNANNASLNSVVLLWILGAVLRGARNADVYDIVSYCYDSLTSNMELAQSESFQSPAASSHMAMCCVLIGETALIDGHQFKEFLVDIIHPLFYMLGNFDSTAIREQASIAIAKVASACGYASPTVLAIENKDYLVDGISMQLNTLNVTPGTFQALASLVYISGSDIIPYLDDVFASLFVLLDRYHGYSALLKGILNVFGALTVVISRSVKLSEQIEAPLDRNKRSPCTSLNDLVTELNRKPEIDPSILEKGTDLKDFATAKSEEENNNMEDEELKDSDNEETDTVIDEPEQAVEKWEFPVAESTYNILSKIAGYCDRLMTHESAEIRMATLKLVTPLIPFLAVNKELFLPLVHKTWPEAISRVFDSETFVAEQAFSCLCAITKYAQAFVSGRIDKLWPKLNRKFSLLLAKKWPQFSPERRVANSLANFMKTAVVYVDDISLATMESAIVAFRPAFLRGEFQQLKEEINSSRPSISDLLWIVLLDEPVKPTRETLHYIEPVYKIST